MKLLKVKAVFTAPYQPQGNLTERKNRDIKSYLVKYINDKQRHWDQFMPLMLAALRAAKVKSTGLTPFEANFGRRMRLPIDIYTQDPNFKGEIGDDIKGFAEKVEHQTKAMVRYAFENMDLASFEQKLQYDANRRDLEFNTGDYVILKVHALSNKAKGISKKLCSKREGPFIILRKLNPLNYVLGDIHSKDPKIFAHIAQLEKYHLRANGAIVTDTDIPGSKDDDNPSIRVPTKYGLSRKRGPKGPRMPQDNTPSIPLGQTDRITRSQTAALNATALPP